MVHTDGTQRDFQQCMGNYFKRMERMFTEDNCGIDYWHLRINRILFPPAISKIVITISLINKVNKALLHLCNGAFLF